MLRRRGAWSAGARAACRLAPALLLALGTACGRRPADARAARGARADDQLQYAGVDDRGIPNYTTRPFTAEERALLRRVYGVEDPSRLYVTDSTDEALLKYDTRVKRCRTCYVNSYRIGFVSVRRAGESWEQVERRVHAMRRRDFPRSALVESTSLDELDPDVRGDVERMLADARTAGFRLRVAASYRSPEREAWLMAEGGSRTHTLTSMHSYGRAIDVLVDDGNLRRVGTRLRWIAFRRWVSSYRDGMFHVLGTPEHSWDFPHVEIPSASVGFRTIDAALASARRCAAAAATPAACEFPPHLPAPVTR